MKQFLVKLSVGLMLFTAACSKSDNTTLPPDPGGDTTGNDNKNPDIRGIISSDQTWTKDKTYRLRGYVYVTNNAKLTIEAGTKIVSNKDSAGVLVIYRGAQIDAQGTSTDPIVFTSNE